MRRVGLAAGTTTTTGSGDLVSRPRAAPWRLPFGSSNVLTPPRTPRPCSSLSGRGRVGGAGPPGGTQAGGGVVASRLGG